MSYLILTGLSSGKHKFTLEYEGEDIEQKCYVVCRCGYRKEIINFKNYGGVKELQRVWDKHTT